MERLGYAFEVAHASASRPLNRWLQESGAGVCLVIRNDVPDVNFDAAGRALELARRRFHAAVFGDLNVPIPEGWPGVKVGNLAVRELSESCLGQLLEALKLTTPEQRTMTLPDGSRVPDPGFWERELVRPMREHAEETQRKLAQLREAAERAAAEVGPMTCDAANRKAMELAEEDWAFVHKTQREWAADIGCSDGLVAKLPFWKMVMAQTGRGKKGMPAKPKASGLTPEQAQEMNTQECQRQKAQVADEVAERELARDRVLEQLTVEQQADWDPSPLEDDLPGRRRRPPRQRKQV
jgi:hypothetical protein